MTDYISSRVFRLFERRLENEPNISATTARALLEDQRTNDFGDDEEILNEIREGLKE